VSVGLETTSKARNIKERKKERKKKGNNCGECLACGQNPQKEEMTYDKPDVQILS